MLGLSVELNQAGQGPHLGQGVLRPLRRGAVRLADVAEGEGHVLQGEVTERKSTRIRAGSREPRRLDTNLCFMLGQSRNLCFRLDHWMKLS